MRVAAAEDGALAVRAGVRPPALSLHRGAGEDDMWLCRPCELKEEGAAAPQCCLCPVTGGALKPTTLRGVWCHLTCMHWIPEVSAGPCPPFSLDLGWRKRRQGTGALAAQGPACALGAHSWGCAPPCPRRGLCRHPGAPTCATLDLYPKPYMCYTLKS